MSNNGPLDGVERGGEEERGHDLPPVDTTSANIHHVFLLCLNNIQEELQEEEEEEGGGGGGGRMKSRWKADDDKAEE